MEWEYLRAWRLHNRMTLLCVARLAGTTHSTVLRWEKGKQSVPDEKFKKLAEIYGCTPAELAYHPTNRARGALLHAAMMLAKDLPLDRAVAWVGVGMTMASVEKQRRLAHICH